MGSALRGECRGERVRPGGIWPGHCLLCGQGPKGDTRRGTGLQPYTSWVGLAVVVGNTEEDEAPAVRRITLRTQVGGDRAAIPASTSIPEPALLGLPPNLLSKGTLPKPRSTAGQAAVLPSPPGLALEEMHTVNLPPAAPEALSEKDLPPSPLPAPSPPRGPAPWDSPQPLCGAGENCPDEQTLGATRCSKRFSPRQGQAGTGL